MKAKSIVAMGVSNQIAVCAPRPLIKMCAHV